MGPPTVVRESEGMPSVGRAPAVQLAVSHGLYVTDVSVAATMKLIVPAGSVRSGVGLPGTAANPGVAIRYEWNAVFPTTGEGMVVVCPEGDTETALPLTPFSVVPPL